MQGYIVVITRNGSLGQRYPISSTECLFGHGPKSDVRLHVANVAKKHCLITALPNEQAYIRNLSPTNRTLINGSPIGDTQYELQHADVITVGDRHFRWEYPSPPKPMTMPKTGQNSAGRKSSIGMVEMPLSIFKIKRHSSPRVVRENKIISITSQKRKKETISNRRKTLHNVTDLGVEKTLAKPVAKRLSAVTQPASSPKSFHTFRVLLKAKRKSSYPVSITPNQAKKVVSSKLKRSKSVSPLKQSSGKSKHLPNRSKLSDNKPFEKTPSKGKSPTSTSKDKTSMKRKFSSVTPLKNKTPKLSLSPLSNSSPYKTYKSLNSKSPSRKSITAGISKTPRLTKLSSSSSAQKSPSTISQSASKKNNNHRPSYTPNSAKLLSRKSLLNTPKSPTPRKSVAVKTPKPASGKSVLSKTPRTPKSTPRKSVSVKTPKSASRKSVAAKTQKTPKSASGKSVLSKTLKTPKSASGKSVLAKTPKTPKSTPRKSVAAKTPKSTSRKSGVAKTLRTPKSTARKSFASKTPKSASRKSVVAKTPRTPKSTARKSVAAKTRKSGSRKSSVATTPRTPKSTPRISVIAKTPRTPKSTPRISVIAKTPASGKSDLSKSPKTPNSASSKSVTGKTPASSKSVLSSAKTPKSMSRKSVTARTSKTPISASRKSDVTRTPRTPKTASGKLAKKSSFKSSSSIKIKHTAYSLSKLINNVKPVTRKYSLSPKTLKSLVSEEKKLEPLTLLEHKNNTQKIKTPDQYNSPSSQFQWISVSNSSVIKKATDSAKVNNSLENISVTPKGKSPKVTEDNTTPIGRLSKRSDLTSAKKYLLSDKTESLKKPIGRPPKHLSAASTEESDLPEYSSRYSLFQKCHSESPKTPEEVIKLTELSLTSLSAESGSSIRIAEQRKSESLNLSKESPLTKRPRGRPPKSPGSNILPQSELPKRPRGRPSKTPLKASPKVLISPEFLSYRYSLSEKSKLSSPNTPKGLMKSTKTSFTSSLLTTVENSSAELLLSKISDKSSSKKPLSPVSSLYPKTHDIFPIKTPTTPFPSCSSSKIAFRESCEMPSKRAVLKKSPHSSSPQEEVQKGARRSALKSGLSSSNKLSPFSKPFLLKSSTTKTDIAKIQSNSKRKYDNDAEARAEKAAKRLKMETPKSLSKNKVAALLVCHGRSPKSMQKRSLYSDVLKSHLSTVKRNQQPVTRNVLAKKSTRTKIFQPAMEVPQTFKFNSTGHANSPETIVISKKPDRRSSKTQNNGKLDTKVVIKTKDTGENLEGVQELFNTPLKSVTSSLKSASSIKKPQSVRVRFSLQNDVQSPSGRRSSVMHTDQVSHFGSPIVTSKRYFGTPRPSRISESSLLRTSIIEESPLAQEVDTSPLLSLSKRKSKSPSSSLKNQSFSVYSPSSPTLEMSQISVVSTNAARKSIDSSNLSPGYEYDSESSKGVRTKSPFVLSSSGKASSRSRSESSSTTKLRKEKFYPSPSQTAVLSKSDLFGPSDEELDIDLSSSSGTKSKNDSINTSGVYRFSPNSSRHSLKSQQNTSDVFLLNVSDIPLPPSSTKSGERNSPIRATRSSYNKSITGTPLSSEKYKNRKSNTKTTLSKSEISENRLLGISENVPNQSDFENYEVIKRMSSTPKGYHLPNDYSPANSPILNAGRRSLRNESMSSINTSIVSTKNSFIEKSLSTSVVCNEDSYSTPSISNPGRKTRKASSNRMNASNTILHTPENPVPIAAVKPSTRKRQGNETASLVSITPSNLGVMSDISGRIIDKNLPENWMESRPSSSFVQLNQSPKSTPSSSFEHNDYSVDPLSSGKRKRKSSQPLTNSVSSSNETSFECSHLVTPKVPLEFFVSPIEHTVNSSGINVSSLNDNDVECSKRFPRKPKSILPSATYTIVEDIKNLFHHSPVSNYTDVRGVKRLLRTPKPNTPISKYSSIGGIKDLFKHSPTADYTDVTGIKRVMSPKGNSPVSRYSDVKGVKKLLKSPELSSPPTNYTNIEGIKEIFKQSPLADYTNVVGVKRLYSTTSEPNYMNVKGVRRIFMDTKTPNSPDLAGVEVLFESPKKIIDEYNQPSTSKPIVKVSPMTRLGSNTKIRDNSIDTNEAGEAEQGSTQLDNTSVPTLRQKKTVTFKMGNKHSNQVKTSVTITSRKTRRSVRNLEVVSEELNVNEGEQQRGKRQVNKNTVEDLNQLKAVRTTRRSKVEKSEDNCSATNVKEETIECNEKVKPSNRKVRKQPQTSSIDKLSLGRATRSSKAETEQIKQEYIVNERKKRTGNDETGQENQEFTVKTGTGISRRRNTRNNLVKEEEPTSVILGKRKSDSLFNVPFTSQPPPKRTRKDNQQNKSHDLKLDTSLNKTKEQEKENLSHTVQSTNLSSSRSKSRKIKANSDSTDLETNNSSVTSSKASLRISKNKLQKETEVEVINSPKQDTVIPSENSVTLSPLQIRRPRRGQVNKEEKPEPSVQSPQNVTKNTRGRPKKDKVSKKQTDSMEVAIRQGSSQILAELSPSKVKPTESRSKADIVELQFKRIESPKTTVKVSPGKSTSRGRKNKVNKENKSLQELPESLLVEPTKRKNKLTESFTETKPNVSSKSSVGTSESKATENVIEPQFRPKRRKLDNADINEEAIKSSQQTAMNKFVNTIDDHTIKSDKLNAKKKRKGIQNIDEDNLKITAQISPIKSRSRKKKIEVEETVESLQKLSPIRGRRRNCPIKTVMEAKQDPTEKSITEIESTPESSKEIRSQKSKGNKKAKEEKGQTEIICNKSKDSQSNSIINLTKQSKIVKNEVHIPETSHTAELEERLNEDCTTRKLARRQPKSKVEDEMQQLRSPAKSSGSNRRMKAPSPTVKKNSSRKTPVKKATKVVVKAKTTVKRKSLSPVKKLTTRSTRARK